MGLSREIRRSSASTPRPGGTIVAKFANQMIRDWGDCEGPGRSGGSSTQKPEMGFPVDLNMWFGGIQVPNERLIYNFVGP